jgi:hypothetical protein
MTKEEIITKLSASRENFLAAIQGLSDPDLTTKTVAGQWTVKDIMAHLTRWEAELVKLLWQARNNVKPTTIHFDLPPVDEINAKWYLESRESALHMVWSDFHGVRAQTVRRVKKFSSVELNDPQQYPWLDSNPLWQWIATDSFEHESEHEAQIRTWRRKGGIEV